MSDTAATPLEPYVEEELGRVFSGDYFNEGEGLALKEAIRQFLLEHIIDSVPVLQINKRVATIFVFHTVNPTVMLGYLNESSDLISRIMQRLFNDPEINPVEHIEYYLNVWISFSRIVEHELGLSNTSPSARSSSPPLSARSSSPPLSARSSSPPLSARSSSPPLSARSSSPAPSERSSSLSERSSSPFAGPSSAG